jgi:hypothetical protein
MPRATHAFTLLRRDQTCPTQERETLGAMPVF